MTEVLYNYEVETDVCVALTTCPGEDRAAQLARALVRKGLAACVTRVAGASSVYRWQGRLAEEDAVQLIVKTTRGRVAALHAAVSELHPDAEPEFLVLDAGGSRSFVEWIVRETAEVVA